MSEEIERARFEKLLSKQAANKNPRPDGTDCCGCLKFGPPPLGFQKCPCSCHWLAFIESPIARELLGPAEEDSAPLRKSKTEKGNMSNIQKENEPVGAFRGDARTIVYPSCQATDNNAYTDAARETPSEEVKMLREQTAAYRRESLARVARRETGRTLCKRCKGSGCVPLDAYRNPKTRKCPDCKGTGTDSMAHREGEQDRPNFGNFHCSKQHSQSYYVIEATGAVTCWACYREPIESAWQKEREALRGALIAAREAFHKIGFTEQHLDSTQTARRAIIEIDAFIAAPQPIPEGYEKKCIKCGWGLSPNQIRCESCLTYVDKPEAQPIPEGGKK